MSGSARPTAQEPSVGVPTKWCPKCRVDLPIDSFYVAAGRVDGLDSYCIRCKAVRNKRHQEARRKAFLGAMGGKCERCGFADHRALQVDHVNGSGRIDLAGRRSTSAAQYARVLANRDCYMLLCANCNQIKRVEQNESVGQRIYTRKPPTERLRGIGRGQASGSRVALDEARTPEHQAAASRARWTR